jgi:hypothetical protein
VTLHFTRVLHNSNTRSQEFIEAARKLWEEDCLPMAEVARQLSVTKGVIAGIVYRNDFTPDRLRKRVA